MAHLASDILSGLAGVRWLRNRGGAIGSLLFVMAVTAGCGGADYQVVVDNQTDQAWMVRVPANANDSEDETSVYRVEPRKRGPAGFWKGMPDHLIEVLRPDCVLIGPLTAGPDGILRVEGVSGLTGQVTAYTPFNVNAPGVAPVEACGGSPPL